MDLAKLIKESIKYSLNSLEEKSGSTHFKCTDLEYNLFSEVINIDHKVEVLD